tara:strand:+ start:195 stop:1094 length:900 start_codon:yes stop_codon:yes gene_type:complete
MARDWNDAGGDWNSNTESWEGEADFPAKANLTLTGQSVIRSQGTSYNPAAASSSIITDYSWDLVSSSWDDTQGTWAAPSITPPNVAVGTLITVSNGSITLTPSAPSFGTDYIFKPSAASIKSNVSLNTWESYGGDWASATDYWEQGFDPAVAVGSTHIPARATMEIFEKTPTVSIGENIVPGVDTLTFAGVAPNVDIMRLTYVPSASMTTTLHVPYAIAGHFAIVDSASLNLNPDKIIWNNYVGDWDSGTDSWDDFVDTRPTVGQTHSYDPTTGELVLTGQQPDGQHRAPKFLPSIQVI